MADILFSEVTNGLPTGSGYFDVLMRSVKAHIEIEYSANRIKGPEYATVYLGAMQSAMQLAEQFVLGEKLQEAQITSMGIDDSLKTAQKAEVPAGTIREDLKNTSEIELKAAQTLLVGKQDLTEVQKALLVTRQIKGFQDDKSVKIFKAQLDAKSVVYSVAPSELTVPTYTYTEVLT